MRLTQTLKQKPTVSPQLVLANQLLQCSSLELEQVIAQELAENPALELREPERCPTCGAEITGGACPTCGSVEVETDSTWRDTPDFSGGDTGTFEAYSAVGEWDDPISRLPSSMTLAQHLLREARLALATEDVFIAHHLIGNLDDRGFLCCDLNALASDLEVERARIDRILAVIQSLDPAGVGARDARECLLIQIERLRGRDAADPLALAERLVLQHWPELGRASFSSLAQEADVSVEEVRGALRFIREKLNPFPAYALWTRGRWVSSEGKAVSPQPDVIIRATGASMIGYEIELPKAGSYGLCVSTRCRRAMGDLSDDQGLLDHQGWKRWEELRGRARLFVKSIEQRWETLYDLMRFLVDYQRDFLIHGERRLRPLTRARVAEMMEVHESTVSRAVAGKYVELPDGTLAPLEVFFDTAAPIKRMIEELIDQEETALSDRVIAERLAEQGYDVARRTVAKYRNALNILPSSLRRRDKELRMRS